MRDAVVAWAAHPSLTSKSSNGAAGVAALARLPPPKSHPQTTSKRQRAAGARSSVRTWPLSLKESYPDKSLVAPNDLAAALDSLLRQNQNESLRQLVVPCRGEARASVRDVPNDTGDRLSVRADRERRRITQRPTRTLARLLTIHVQALPEKLHAHVAIIPPADLTPALNGCRRQDQREPVRQFLVRGRGRETSPAGRNVEQDASDRRAVRQGPEPAVVTKRPPRMPSSLPTTPEHGNALRQKGVT
jgi:hypothetical protein